MWTNPHYNLGLLPAILDEQSRDPARTQIANKYAHGGGYFPLTNAWEFKLNFDRDVDGSGVLKFPGDPDFEEVARNYLPHSKELCILFDYSFVAIVQADNTYTIVRLN